MKFKAGDRVRAVSGPYAGATGFVKSLNALDTAPFPYAVRFQYGGGPVIRAVSESEIEFADKSEAEKPVDNVNHPSHYTWLPNGLEVIDLIEHLMTNRGNAVKYLCRAGRKDPATELEDLKKARWYVEREISRVEKGNANG